MNKQITCNVIRDIIPLYSENLCSEDSAEIVKEHIEECSDCRRLLEGFGGEEHIPEVIPDEAKAMKKINLKIKRSKKAVIAAICAIIAVLIPAAVLWGNMFWQNKKIPSFETIARNKEVKEYSDLIENGKFHSFARWISLNWAEAEYFENMGDKDKGSIPEAELEKADGYAANLVNAYNVLIGDAKEVEADCRTYYSTDMFEESQGRKGLLSEITVEYSGGETLVFYVIKENGRFVWSCTSDGSFDEEVLREIFQMYQ